MDNLSKIKHKVKKSYKRLLRRESDKNSHDTKEDTTSTSSNLERARRKNLIFENDKTKASWGLNNNNPQKGTSEVQFSEETTSSLASTETRLSKLRKDFFNLALPYSIKLSKDSDDYREDPSWFEGKQDYQKNISQRLDTLIEDIHATDKVDELSEMVTKAPNELEKLDEEWDILTSFGSALKVKSDIQPYIDYIDYIDLDKDLTQQDHKDLLRKLPDQFTQLDKSITEVKAWLDSEPVSKDNSPSNHQKMKTADTELMNSFKKLKEIEKTSLISLSKIIEFAEQLRAFEVNIKEVQDYKPVSSPNERSAIAGLEKHFQVYSDKLQKHFSEAKQLLASFQVKGKNVSEISTELAATQQDHRDLQKSSQDLSGRLQQLTDIKEELRKTLNVIGYRKQYSTAEAILNQFGPSTALLENYEMRPWEMLDGKPMTNEVRDSCNQEIQRLVEPTKIWHRRPLGAFVEFLRHGRMVHLFEGGYSSDGDQLAEHRLTANKKLAGYQDLPGELQPICASAIDHPDGRLASVEKYGIVASCYEEYVKLYSTITFGDSLELVDCGGGPMHIPPNETDLKVKLAPFTNPTVDCYPKTARKKPGDFRHSSNIEPYIETQIHFGVTVYDQSKVVLYTQELLSPNNKDIEEAKKLLQEAKELLDHYKIPYIEI